VSRFKPSASISKRNIHGSKVLLCISWDMKGVVYYELKQSLTKRYQQ